MENPNDAAIKRLEADWPNWQIWVANRTHGGPVWCARRWDWQPGGTILNEDNAEHLAEQAEQ